MALRALVSRWPVSAGLAAASLTAGGVALCDSDLRAGMFDPEALERGAKALREINQSPHAKRVRLQLFLPELLAVQINQGG